MQAQQSSTSLQRQIKRLKKRMTRWRFQTLTSHKKAQLQRRLMRYEQQLYRLGSTAALSTLGLSALQGQAFCEQVGSDSPFDGLAVAGESTPQLVDVDGDGDLDLVSGIGGNDNQPINGQIAYYQNDGNNNFIQQMGTDNPFDGIDVGREAAPQLVDVDGDGDLDLISGEVFGRVFYYQNDGNNNFIRRTGTDNPFNGIDTGYYSKPQLIDFDGDGD
ncbi:MAG: FG-GAP-like repeat-containing protein [Bacteroidota bacterium]